MGPVSAHAFSHLFLVLDRTHTKRRPITGEVEEVDVERGSRPVRRGHAGDGALDLIEGEEGSLNGSAGWVVCCCGGRRGGKA